MAFLENIKAIPITDYASKSGYTLVRKGRYYSLKEHDSVIIDVNRNCFWRNSKFVQGIKGSAGSIIDFVMEFGYASDHKEAIKELASLYGIESDKELSMTFAQPPVEKRAKKETVKGSIELPEQDKNNSKVFAYLLKERCLEQSVIRYFLAKKMLYQDKHQNCVFHTGTTFACLRGTDPARKFILDMEGCDYDECFYFRGSNDAKVLVVAESVIDIMSVMSHFCKEKMRYTNFCYLALSGTGKLASVFYHAEQEAKNGRPFDKVLIATDTDEAGEKASVLIKEGLKERNIAYERFAPPKGKDWNEYMQLLAKEDKKEA